ncbi:MAG TPA: type 1 glutamine amidotransferase domain-containing protein [Bacteroidales bacterium]|nr:type 1 glutamine amidotransferase domain-containing protein [Bacteroidales bacterium]
MNELKGKKVAILATDGFEESELFEPKKALEENGAIVHIISPEKGKIKAWNHGNWSKDINVDITLSNSIDMDYDALFLPGGVINPDKLRRDERAVDFVQRFMFGGKLVAAICHGPQLLIEADVVEGRRMTSFSSIKKDLMNAGAEWVDEEVVIDNNLITSRSPKDLKAFNKKLIEEVAKVVETV